MRKNEMRKKHDMRKKEVIMTRITVLAAAAAAIILLGLTVANAHHGWGSYDAANPVTLEGTVSELSYSNPHATLKLKTADKSWTVTLAPVSRMTTRGATEDKIAVGKSVSAHGYPSKAQPDEIRAEWIKIGGETIQLR
jgi:hypothetical protein